MQRFIQMITILMPIYNGIEFIDESVGSVLLQTYENWELIIGINGHPENSTVYQTAKKYESEKVRIVDFHQIKGKANTLNEMVKISTYDHIALLDVDDIWHNTKLAYQIPFVFLDYDVVGTNCVYFGEREGVSPRIPNGDISNFDFFSVNPIINSSVIIRKSLCWWNENGIEDYDLWLSLQTQNKRFYNCPQILVKHRLHQESGFNSKGNNNLVNDLKLKYK
jgi:teichuronic acid biosynthesis glycosyltransferase TuaG